jgi:pimeloyl-ACP methyl ester carboxylesterase
MSKTSSAVASTPPIGRPYDIAGRRLCLHRSGAGGPAVVFLPGAGLIGLDFLNVHQETARFTTSVIYDRAGTGWSDGIALPRSAAAVAEELRSLLAAAEVPPPYVLVGHSLGGAYTRRYTQLFPQEVAGLLFLDPAHESYQAMRRQSLVARVRQVLSMARLLPNPMAFYRPMFAAMFARWPDAERRILVDYHARNWSKSLAEAKNLQIDVLDEIAGGEPTPDVPMVVLTAMGIDPFMAPFMDRPYLLEVNRRKREFYDAFARSVPQGENRLLDDAGHSTLHTDRPDAVVQAIRDLIAAVGSASAAPAAEAGLVTA